MPVLLTPTMTFSNWLQKPTKVRRLHALVDEAQFLNKEQVLQLSKVVDFQNIPVLAFGLRTDFLSVPSRGVSIYWLGRRRSRRSRPFVIVGKSTAECTH